MTSRPWKSGATVGSLVGLLAAAFAMRAAWLHNPQGAIYDASGIDWGYWFAIGLSWFLPVALLAAFAIGGTLSIARCLRRTSLT